MLCSEAPMEILQESSYAGDEPTKFLLAFFAAGHGQWLAQTYGVPVTAFPKERVARAALVLWSRACELYTSRLYCRPRSDWGEPFFSDEGLY
jgi:hypothetical protein